MPVPAASSEKASLIWIASSRVGVRISALTPGHVVLGSQLLEQRQEKRQRLARAGLRRDHEVMAGELLGDSHGLHRRGLDESIPGQVGLQGCRKGESRKKCSF